MPNFLLPGERADDLELDGLVCIQDPSSYCFTSDAVLLANYVKCGPKDRVIELCAGSGVISTIVGYKRKPKSITMVEIQKNQADRARRTFLANNMQAEVICEKLQGISNTTKKYSFDVCYVNPPYRKSQSDKSTNPSIAISTHEVEITLSELMLECEHLLKFGGKLFMVYPVDRLSELMSELNKNKIEPKQMTFVFPKAHKKAELVLLTAVKGGKPGLIITPSVIEKNIDGSNTEIMKSIYNSR